MRRALFSFSILAVACSLLRRVFRTNRENRLQAAVKLSNLRASRSAARGKWAKMLKLGR